MLPLIVASKNEGIKDDIKKPENIRLLGLTL